MSSILTLHRHHPRRGFTLIEMTIVVLIIGILAMIAVPSYLKCRENSQIRVCRSHLRHLQDAKERWALENHKTNTDEPTLEQLVPTYLKESPSCPADGTYSLGAVGENPECTVAGHTLY